jgi:hypothetical protein
MLYSHNNKYPKELPNRIRLSDGQTRTDASTFTEEEISDAGYVPVNDPPVILDNQELTWSGTEWVVTEASEEEKLKRAWAKIRELRDGTISGIQWRVERYHSEVRLGLTPTDDIANLDRYIQELRDITNSPDPFAIEWPSLETLVNESDLE